MITPIELQSKTFRSGFGYDKKDVENFVNELQVDYEFLYKENMELNDKISVLNEGLNYYKTIEKTIQKALVLAEQTAEETKEAARVTAKSIENEARANAGIILADAKNDYNKLREQTIQIMRQYESYKAQFKHLAAAQYELLESETFNIHIANLDMFKEMDKINHPSRQETIEQNKSDGQTVSKHNKGKYSDKKSDTHKETDIAMNVAATKEETDFEFIDIED
jgi:cell division initiation protein